jgi:tetratricopeptide (TPR) repeat protein
MSLIADALKRVQSGKLGKRYASSDPSAALPGMRQRGSSAGAKSLLSKFQISPTILVGLGSGILLFVLLSAYFFYGRGTKVQLVTTAASKGLILAPPPSVPTVQPLILEKGEPPADNSKEQAFAKREGPPEPERRQEPAASDRTANVRGKAAERAPLGEPTRRSDSSKVKVTPDLSEEVRRRYDLALSYQQEKNLTSARREYEKVVELWPLYAEAHNNLGVVYKELGMYEQATAELNKALALNPKYARAYHNLGVIYQLKEDWRQAAKNYETALSLDRNQLSSYNNIGLVYRAQKQPHEARQILEKALAINPYFAQTHYNLALVLEEIGELDQARLHYQKFVAYAGEDHRRLVETVRARLEKMAAR